MSAPLSTVETLASLPAGTLVELRGRSYFTAGPQAPRDDDGRGAVVSLWPMWGDVQVSRRVGHGDSLLIKS